MSQISKGTLHWQWCKISPLISFYFNSLIASRAHVACSTTEQEIECKLLITIIAFECLNTDIFWEAHFHELFHLGLDIFFLCIVLHPLFSCELVQLPVCLILACDLRILRIIWFWTTQQCLQWDECGSNCQSGSPLVLQNIEADSASLWADIWMPYLCVELHLWRLKWVIWWNVDVHVEDSTFVACVFLFN